MDSNRLSALQELLRDLPVVDIHTHLGNGGVWRARDLADVLFYHWLGTELRNAGCPQEVVSGHGIAPRERVRLAAPYCALVRNTVNHWAFMNLVRDLYNFTDDFVTEDNWGPLFDAVVERSEDPAWEAEVLGRANVVGAAVGHERWPREGLPYFPYALGEPIYGAPWGGSLVQAQRAIGADFQSARELEAAIVGHLEQWTGKCPVHALHLWMPATWRYRPTTVDAADDIIARWRSGDKLSAADYNALSSFAADVASCEAGQHGLVVQLFHGSIAYDGGPQVSIWDPEWLRCLVPHFAQHPETEFDLLLATRSASHEATALCRQYPNLTVSGGWWHGFTPTTLTEFFRDRLELLPLTRWNAFYSDAYCVEWVYGKLSVTRNRLAVALCGLIEEELLAERDTEPIARAVLCENPKRLYRL